MSRSRRSGGCGRDCGVCAMGPTNQARLHRSDIDHVERKEMHAEATEFSELPWLWLTDLCCTIGGTDIRCCIPDDEASEVAQYCEEGK